MIEILVVVGVLGIALVTLTQVIQLSFRLSHIANDRVEAVYLAREGMEALRYLRDDSWTSYIAPLSTTTIYHLSFNGSRYATTTTAPALINKKFQRQFTTASVFRDSNDNIAGSGTADTSTVQLTMKVLWQVGTVSSTESIIFYLTNLFQN